MNSNTTNNNEVKKSIITLLNTITDIVGNTETKSKAAKKVLDNFTTKSNGLLKDLCEMIDVNFDSVFNDFINQSLDKATAKEFAKPYEEKQVQQGTGVTDGTTLFEPLKELSKEELYSTKNGKSESTPTKGNDNNKVCNVNDKCNGCAFADICFMNIRPKKQENKNNENKVNVVNISNTTDENKNNIKDTKKQEEPVIINDLRNEYRDTIKKKAKQDVDNELMNTVPEVYTKNVFDILADKKSHAYKFIKGTEKANPAVEVKLKDTYNVGNKFNIMMAVCDRIKKEGKFPLVTASQPEGKDKEGYAYITFYLVLY